MLPGTHHGRAGKLGGEATRDRHAEKGFYQWIGAQNGRRTMELHGDLYADIRRRAGHRTRASHGAAYYRELAARSARRRQAQNALRDQAIQTLLEDGWRIPTIVGLTWDDLPRLQKYLDSELGAYLERERPACEADQLFVSRAGKPLGVASTYTVIKHFRERQSK